MIRFGEVGIDSEERIITNGDLWHQWDDRTPWGKPFNISFHLTKHLLLSGGMTGKQLFDILYAHDEEGGPLYGHKVIKVRIAQLRPVWEKLNLVLKTIKHNSYFVYWLIPKCV